VIDRVKSVFGYIVVGVILLSVVAFSYSSLIFAVAFSQWVSGK